MTYAKISFKFELGHDLLGVLYYFISFKQFHQIQNKFIDDLLPLTSKLSIQKLHNYGNDIILTSVGPTRPNWYKLFIYFFLVRSRFAIIRNDNNMRGKRLMISSKWQATDYKCLYLEAKQTKGKFYFKKIESKLTSEAFFFFHF